jgi:hypothetical protein
MSEAILGALREVPAKGIGARYVRGPSALPASLSKPHAAIETGSGQVPELWRDVSAIIAVKTMLIAAEK